MFSSPALDSLLQNDSATYCLVSGGINGLGPTIFLYTLPSSVPGEDLEDSLAKQWTYLGPLIGPPTREWPRSRWVGDIGLNWECAGMFTLPAPSPLPSRVDQTVAAARQGERQWIILGSEGKYTHSLTNVLPGEEEEGKSPMWQLWYAGTLLNNQRDPTATAVVGAVASQEGDDGVKLDVELEGVLDWGCLYATQTFLCTDGRRFMWGE
jgi:sucrose-6-phosphate hydrolase SacC (GH32 family)